MSVVKLNVRSKFDDLNITGLMASVSAELVDGIWNYKGEAVTDHNAAAFMTLVREHADYIHTTNDVYRCMTWIGDKKSKRIYVDAYCNKLRVSVNAFIRGQLKELSHEFIKIGEME